MNGMTGMSARVSQKMIDKAGQNMDLLRRLTETLSACSLNAGDSTSARKR